MTRRQKSGQQEQKEKNARDDQPDMNRGADDRSPKDTNLGERDHANRGMGVQDNLGHASKNQG